MATKRYQKKWSITYWLITGMANSLRVLTWIPQPLQTSLGKVLGRLLMKYSPRMHQVTKKNIELCFPDFDEATRHQFLKKNFENLGIGVFESVNSAWKSNRALLQLIDSIEGLEALMHIYHQGNSAVLLFPHMIPMYLIGHMVSLKTNIPTALMYHSPKNKALDDFLYNKLAPHVEAVFNRKNIRNMINYLKEGQKCVWYAADLDIGRAHSDFAPFFGSPASTLTAPIRIAKLTGASFFPVGFYRNEAGKYCIKIYPALDNFPSDNVIADLTQINANMEKIIRQKPEQYLWQYKRFSTRPLGEQKVY